jgi:hypothetical protein
MSGAVAILVAKGVQDQVLSGPQPEISFFRSNFKRHVNFSQAVLSQVVTGTTAAGDVSVVEFTKKGDLLSYVYLTKKVNGTLQPTITSQDIKQVELLIGDQVVDTMTTDQLVSLRNFNERYPRTFRGTEDSSGNLGFENLYHYPLGFFFCEAWSACIPLVALQYHSVRVRITWGPGASSSDVYECWTNYVYLDTDEREYATRKRDILIYQHQESPTGRDLMFNNPVSFIFGKAGVTDIFGKNSPNISDTIKLQINGTDIVEEKELVPHYTILPTMYHTLFGKWDVNPPISNVHVTKDPGETMVIDVNFDKDKATNVSFVYPFALSCSSFQPTGSCNFSRLDSVKLISSSPIVKPIYARNYNILRIDNGMGGILFGN